MWDTLYSEEFARIAVEAENEETLEQTINEFFLTWLTVVMVVLQAPDNPNQLVLSGIPEITDVLDDSFVKCNDSCVSLCRADQTEC
jgi:hypothetical protein